MDAYLVTLRESLQFSAIIFLLTGVYREYTKSIFITALLTVCAGFTVTALNFPVTGNLEKAYSSFMFYSFLVILLMSFVSVRHVIIPIAGTLLALLFPSAQLASVITGEAYLKGATVYLVSVTGAATAAVILTAAIKATSRVDLLRYFNSSSTMVVLASLCFMTGGAGEFSSESVIVFLQKGIHSLLFSVISPDGTVAVSNSDVVLSTADQLKLFFTSERFAMALTAVVLFVPPVYVFVRLLLQPEPTTEGVEVKAEKRKILAIHTDELIRKGTPLLLALLVNIVLLHAANLAMAPSHDPEPIPLVIEGDAVRIPLKSQMEDLSDGKLRKYSVSHNGSTFRLIVMTRPDGTIVTALDACEICPPWGYVQRGRHLVCKYCGTPIPVDSLGITGGCNPVPVKSTMENGSIVIKRNDIVTTYNKWIGGK
jgi:uncharacterized membrane protein